MYLRPDIPIILLGSFPLPRSARGTRPGRTSIYELPRMLTPEARFPTETV
jgi:hypothetical protein